MDHTYEEIRSVAIDILAGREKPSYAADQVAHLVIGVAEILEEREGRTDRRRGSDAQLSVADRELVREVFWDLFRQGVITIGSDNANQNYPHFKVSQFGKRILENENTYFFHDLSTYTTLIKSNVPDINDTTLLYLQEAMQSFKSGCMLAATVMLGVASEHSFLLLLESAEGNSTYGSKFANAAKQRTILQKFRKFKAALDQHVMADLPSEIKEDLDIDFAGVLSVIRTFRNESGHPSGKILGREQTYVLLQMFIPYCKKIYQLTDFFK
ncbi:MAG: hypothetical protein KY475_00435 [Planctomycetes bacterium]|nr:hypothetical protein [Planctomycetota bacterium]